MPPDSSVTIVPARSWRRKSSSSRSARPGRPAPPAEEAAVEVEVLVGGAGPVQGVELGHHPDRALDRRRVAPDVDPVDQHRPAGRHDPGRGHPDGGRLAGAVGAEQAEQLALADCQIDPVDRVGLPGPPVLDEPLDLDDRLPHGRPTYAARSRFAPPGPRRRRRRRFWPPRRCRTGQPRGPGRRWPSGRWRTGRPGPPPGSGPGRRAGRGKVRPVRPSATTSSRPPGGGHHRGARQLALDRDQAEALVPAGHDQGGRPAVAAGQLGLGELAVPADPAGHAQLAGQAAQARLLGAAADDPQGQAGRRPGQRGQGPQGNLGALLPVEAADEQQLVAGPVARSRGEGEVVDGHGRDRDRGVEAGGEPGRLGGQPAGHGRHPGRGPQHLAQAARAAGRVVARRTSVPCKVVTSGNPVRRPGPGPRPGTTSGRGPGRPRDRPAAARAPAASSPARASAPAGWPPGGASRPRTPAAAPGRARTVAAHRDPVEPFGRGQPRRGRRHGRDRTPRPAGDGQPQQEPPVTSSTDRGNAWARNRTRRGSGHRRHRSARSAGDQAQAEPPIGNFDQGVGQGRPEPGRELVAEAGDDQEAGPGDGRGRGLAAADTDDLVLAAVDDHGRHPDPAESAVRSPAARMAANCRPVPLGW